MMQSASQQMDADQGTSFHPIDHLNGFVEQEQGWIWGFDFLLPSSS
jgi:hypothetical protein